MFHLLEADFNPLELCTKLAPLLEKLPGLNAEVSVSRNLKLSAPKLHLISEVLGCLDPDKTYVALDAALEALKC